MVADGQNNDLNKRVVMVIAFRDFRDPEYFVPKQIFETASFTVKTASTKKGVAIGADGGEADVDMLVSEINTDNFDAIVFVGGPGCLKHLDNNASYRVIKEVALKPKALLASICISPVILAKAGVLKGTRATVWTSEMDKKAVKILEENNAIYTAQPVVVDDRIITASGPDAAFDFGEAVVKGLTNSRL